MCCFNQDNPHFLVFRALSSPVIRWWLREESVCWWWDEDAELKTNRVTADAGSDHHWQSQPYVGSQALGAVHVKFTTALLMSLCGSCGSSSQMVSRATFNSSVVLGFSWSLLYCFTQRGAPDVIFQESLGATHSSQWTWDNWLSSAWC